ncbi:MAG: hypothetical protein CV087_10520 [Candidatus Brocadia sp. WS118]|nr:MAG: hypothetical protein CV087_10520 [Candidatus Brocadia sp. WS118]
MLNFEKINDYPLGSGTLSEYDEIEETFTTTRQWRILRSGFWGYGESREKNESLKNIFKGL